VNPLSYKLIKKVGDMNEHFVNMYMYYSHFTTDNVYGNGLRHGSMALNVERTGYA